MENRGCDDDEAVMRWRKKKKKKKRSFVDSIDDSRLVVLRHTVGLIIYMSKDCTSHEATGENSKTNIVVFVMFGYLQNT